MVIIFHSQNLLASIENNWLRHWKGLLLGRPVHNDDEQKLNQATSKVMEYLSTMGFTDVDESLLKVSMLLLKKKLSQDCLAL